MIHSLTSYKVWGFDQIWACEIRLRGISSKLRRVPSVCTFHRRVDSCNQNSSCRYLPFLAFKKTKKQNKKKAACTESSKNKSSPYTIQKPYQLSNKRHNTSPTYYTRENKLLFRLWDFPRALNLKLFIDVLSVTLFPSSWRSSVGGAFSKH